MKSIISKILGRKSQPQEFVKEPEEIQHEISFAETLVEKAVNSKATAEIEVFVNYEKINIFEISGETRIGRDPTQTEIAIPELIISKLHCSLYIKDDGVYIKDMDSTNGTYVNGQEISAQKLEDNDEISLGRKGTVRIVFHKKEKNYETG